MEIYPATQLSVDNCIVTFEVFIFEKHTVKVDLNTGKIIEHNISTEYGEFDLSIIID